MPKVEKVICCSLEENERKGEVQRLKCPLEGEPGVAQAVCGCGSFLRDQLQHGQEEVSEALGLFVGPLVLLHQHLQQTPRLQLSDVFQITCNTS